VSRTPLIRALLIGCLATVSSGCGVAESLPGGRLTAAELGAMLERHNPGSGPYSCTKSNGDWDFVCTFTSTQGEAVKMGVDVTATAPKEQSIPVPVDRELPTAGKPSAAVQRAFAHRIAVACAARANELQRLPSPSTRGVYLKSFTARRLAEANFAVAVRHIVPPKMGMLPFQRLTAAAQNRVEAVDRFHNAVVARQLGEARAAFAETRSASVVIAREARALGASC
jgi:hypothetical protein